MVIYKKRFLCHVQLIFFSIQVILTTVIRLQILVKPAIAGGAEAPLFFYASKKPEL